MNENEDVNFEVSLLSDQKELAEHNMLVDLGRNDIGRISKFGTVKVEKYQEILRFSHVMHIGSTVSGEYQPVAHLYCREVFGDDFAFRAGTIGTVAEKTAFGYVKGFIEDTHKEMRTAEIERVAKGCEGVHRTSGQHPGGIIVV